MATRATPKKTVGEIIFDSEQTPNLKHYIVANMKKVVSVMIEKKIVNKKLAKHCIKTNDSEYLLAYMKKDMTLDDILGFLEILTEFGSHEGYDGETRKLMRLMSGSVEAIKPEPNSEHAAIINRFISVAFDRSLSPAVEGASPSETESQTILAQPTAIPSEPPPGQFGNTVSHCFTRKGGVLYSPLHGVTVTIPPNAIPGVVDTFNLSMHFYLGHPFTVEEDVDLCSVVVWFHLYPQFEFLEDVTVEIPHAADADPTSLRVLTWGDDKQGPSYKLDTEVLADFSDGYHAVFKMKHFSPYVVAKTYRDGILHKKARIQAFKKRTGTSSSSGSFKSLERMSSDSIERSIDEGLVTLVGRSSSADNGSTSKRFPHQEAVDRDSPIPTPPERNVGDSGLRYSIACSMPKDRSGGQWDVKFAASYDHPTGNSVTYLAE